MNQFGIPSKLIKFSQKTLENTLSYVKAVGGISNLSQHCKRFSSRRLTIMQLFQYPSRNDHESVQLSDIQHDQREQIQPHIGICGRRDIDVIGRTKLDVESIFLEIKKMASSYGKL